MTWVQVQDWSPTYLTFDNGSWTVITVWQYFSNLDAYIELAPIQKSLEIRINACVIHTVLKFCTEYVIAVDLCSYAAAIWVWPDGEEQSQVYGAVIVGSECYHRNSGSAGMIYCDKFSYSLVNEIT